jgi:hypothetical protein
VFEEEGGATSLDGAVGNLSDFEGRIDFRRDALELTFLPEFLQEVLEISIGQLIPLLNKRGLLPIGGPL